MKSLTIWISILLLVLSIRFFTFYQDQPTYRDGQELSLTTTLFSEGSQAGRYQRLTARLAHGERVFITIPSYPRYSYGQTLQIEGRLQIKEVDRGRIFTMSYPSIQATSAKNPFLNLISPVRSRILQLFAVSLPQPAGNLLLGIVFGIDEGMPKAFDKALQKAGVLHVIAASGMNVTIIGSFFASVFGRILKRRSALVLTIAGIILYAGLAGFSASIVRAAIMGILVFSAQILGRQTFALYGLLLAAFSMLLYQPFLLFDTGFQLSFMATWGLIVFNPLLQLFLKRKSWIVDLIAKSDLLTTLIAQIATLPILLGAFGSYSPVSILVNFLILWTIPILMIIGGIGAIVGLAVPLLGQWLFYLALPFLYYFEAVVWFFGKSPLAIEVASLSWPILTGYYLLLLAAVFAMRSKHTQKKKGAKSFENIGSV